MPTIQQIEQAMIAADRAGDTAAAQILAEEIRRLMEEAQPRKGGISGAFQRGLESQLSSGRTGAGVYTGSPEEAAEAARAGLARQEDIGRRYEDEIGLERLKKVYEEKGLLAAGKEVGRQIPLALAEQAPQIAATLGGARLGATAGAPFGPTGALIGGLGGAAFPSFLMASGSQAERRAQEQAKRGEQVSIDRGELATTAVPSTALDVASTLIPLGKTAVSQITKIPLKAFSGRTAAQAEKLANERLLATLTKGTATGVAVEVPTEILQQMLERAQAGLPLASPEAYAEYGDTAYRVSLLGPLGAAGRLSEKGAARDELAAQQAAAVTAPTEALQIAEAPQAAEEIPIEERRFRDITPIAGAPAAERRFSDITPIPATPTPPVAPEKVDIYKMMESHDTLKSSLDPLADQIYKARQEGDTETARTLMQEYRDNEAAMNALATRITEAGGVLESSEEAEAAYNKQLKTLDSKIAKEQNTITEMSRADVRDYDAVDKAEKRLAKLQAERSAAEEEFQRKRGVLRVKETPPGEQISLFDTEEQTPKAEEVLKFKTEKGEEFTAADIEKMTQGPVQTTALSKDTENQIAQKQAEADDLLKQIAAMRPRVAPDAERQSVLDRLNEARQKYRDLQEQEGKLSEASAQPGFYDSVDSAKGGVRRQITELERELASMAPRNVNQKFLKDYYAKSDQLNKIYGEIDALNAAPIEQTKQPVDIFDYSNQLRTATLNNDPKAIIAIINQLKKESKVIPEATRERAEKKAGERAQRGMSEKDKLVQTLGQRLGLPGRISERTVTEEEYQRIADRISYLMDMIDKPVGRAKMSVKDKVEKLGREIAGLTETLKNKDLPPATRQGASKSRNAKVKEYNHLIENVMVPARDEIFALYRSMFTVKEVAPVGSAEKMLAADAEKTRKDLLKEFEERVENYGPESPQVREFVEKNLSVKMSPQYKRYKKIIEGKGITASPKRVAMEIGRETDEYKKFAAPKEKEIAKRKAAYEKYEADAKAELAKLKARVGETSEDYKNRVNEYTKGAKQKLDAWKNFEKAATKAMDAKAEELGKASPEYRSRKLKATKEYKEAVAAGEQEIETKRTTQATRKVAKLSRMQTASEESRARTRTIQEKREPGLLPSQAGEKPEVPFKPKAEPKSASAMLSAFQAAATKRLKETGKFARGVEVESPDLTAAQIKMLEDNNLTGVLRGIADDKNASDLNRVVAARLAAMLDETNVELADKLYDSEGKEVLGEAISTNIKLSRAGGLSQEVLLHEATHAAVERVIQMPDSMLTKEQVIAKRELLAMYNSIKNDPNITSANAKSSLSEFAAEVFSNRNLQEQLRKKKWRGSNMWEGLKSVILRMLGVKVPDTMLGAALKSVDLLMIPSSNRIGRLEVPVNRQYSAKDIAALHTGSNSMRQFAEQFGPEIKQKDRTPEDVERLASEYLTEMENKPKEFVAQAHPLKLDYKSAMTMSDGTLYDEDNLQHFLEADAATLAAVKANNSASMAMEEARAINKARNEALTSLTVYLSTNPDYTLAEQALVAKAASKYGVASGKDGVLRVVNISENNRHPVAVVGRESANAIIGKLREGRSLKDAFIEGMQELADKNAKENRNKTGWQKFDQVTATAEEKATAGISSVYTQDEILAALDQSGYDRGHFEDIDEMTQQLIDDGLLTDRSSRIAGKNKLQDAAVALNAGAAGTSWCTGSSVSTARSQIEKGDFYIYYENGKPQVAVRMNGANQIGEIRGNTPSQGLTSEQQTIAKQFLQTKKFKGSDAFIKETEQKAALTDLVAGKKDLSVEDLFNMGDVVYNGELNERSVNRLLDFNQLFGYLSRDPSAKVAAEFKKIIEQQIANKYRQGYWVYSALKNGSKITPDSVQEDTMLGKNYTLPTNKIKAGQSLTVSTGSEHYTALEYLGRAALFNQEEITFPRLRYINEITVFKGPPRVLRVADGAVINKIETTLDENVEATILGEVTINNASLLGRSGTLTLTAPDAKSVVETRPEIKDLARTAFDTYFIYLNRKFGEDPAKPNMDALHKVTPPTSGPVASTVEKLFKYIGKTFGDAAVKEARKDTEGETLYVQLKKTVTNLYNQIGDVNRILAMGEKQFDDMHGFLKEEPIKNPFPTGVGRVIAPNIVRPGEQTLRVAAERPRYAPKDIGVQEDKPGVFSFKSYVQPGATQSSIVADEPRTVDTLKANFLGIAGRVQFVDKFAAISEAFKKGMDAKKISQLEAGNGEYYLRFGENRSQYAQQALTNGPISRVVSRETPEGKEYIYRSEAGANLMRVFQTLEKSGIKNSTELDRMFTVYQAGKRAKQVGWEKLWVGNPAKAKAEYDAVMAQLNSNPQMRDAFEAASKEYKEFNNGLVDFLVQTGAMTKEQADKLKSIDYVPYYRVNKGSGDVELFTDKEVPIRIGNIKDEPQLQQLVGDNTQILPLSVSSVQNAFMLVDMGLRNQRIKDTSFLLHKIGFAKTLAKGEGPANRDTVRFKVKGVPYYAIIDTDLYGIPADLIVKGMEGIKTTLPMAVKAMGVPADILRKFVTRNPAYAIRQAIRDPLTAWMTTGTDGVPILNSFKQLSSMVAGRNEAERKLMASGAISSNVFTGDQEDFKRFLRDISAGKSGWEKLMAKADAFAMQGDAATRAVVYEDSIAKGLSEQQALLRTLESMNFGRRGLSPTMYYLNTLIPFFNAQIQGLDVLYRAFTNKMPYSEQLKIREKLIARGLLMGAATLAYAAMMQDDEAYKRAKPEERLANWFVYIPGMDQPLKVPIPFELGYLFKSLPEAVFNMGAADEKSKDITKGMGKLMMLSNPFALPQAVKPVTELYLGKSFFGGDIESQREIRNMLPTERFRSTTTELSKVLGGATGDAGITPIGWDHLFRGYTGGLGIALISLANPILNTEASAVEQPSKKLHQTPFIGGLFQPVEGRGTLDAAYERMLEIQQAKGAFNDLVQQGKREEALEFLGKYREKVIASSLSGAVQQRLGELSTMRRRIIEAPNLSQEKKDKLLERLDDQQTLIAQRFLAVTSETKPQADRP
jgi:hypothetical protein